MELDSELLQKMHEDEQSIVPDNLRSKGWVYRDIPGRMSHEMWDLFLSILGEGNYEVVAMTTAQDYKRGQFFLSPQALENLKEYR